LVVADRVADLEGGLGEADQAGGADRVGAEQAA
jgi:hypothetical protein